MYRVKFDKENKIWSNCEYPLLYNPNLSLAFILLRSMELNGSKLAQISDDTGERFTFEELRMMTIRVAQNLQRRGYGSKQVVGFMVDNRAYLAPITFASLCLGYRLSASRFESKYTFLATKPSLIFCEVEMYDFVVEYLTESGNCAKVFTFNGVQGDSEPVENLFTKTGTEHDPVEVDGINEIALISSTSGTTGQSKGVCLSHAAFLAEIDSANLVMYSNGIAFNPNLFSCISNALSLLLATVGGTTRIITAENYSLELQLRIIEDYKVTVIEIDAYDVLLMLKSDLMQKCNLSSIKHVITGGCKIPFTMLQKFNSFLPNGNVHNEYGLVEVGGVSMEFPHFSGKENVGRLLNGISIKIVDDEGNRCGVGVDGEVCVKGRFKFLGYYKNKELTDAAIDSDGFFLSGDIGHMDENGYLHITDRKKEVIEYEFGWVWPSKIESILLKMPEIQSVCVVGVPFDEVAEIPAAVVERANGSQISELEICKMVEEADLSENYKLRGGVYFVDTIPMSVTGKPLRREIKTMAAKLYREKCFEQQAHEKNL